MAIAATLDLFGQNVTTVVLQTTDNFNGSTHSAVPANVTMKPGRAYFAAQAGGGKFNFHDRQIVVRNVVVSTGMEMYIRYEDLAIEILVHTFSTDKLFVDDIYLSPGESLVFKSTSGAGAKQVAVTAELSGPSKGVI